MQTKHTSENAARAAARKEFKNDHVQIVESGKQDPACGWIPVFYVETGADMGMIRNHERHVYSGKGKDA